MLGWAQGAEASGGGNDPGKRGWSWHSPYSRPGSMGICLPSAAAHLSRHTDTFSLPFIHPLIHTTRVEAVLGGGVPQKFTSTWNRKMGPYLETGFLQIFS